MRVYSPLNIVSNPHVGRAHGKKYLHFSSVPIAAWSFLSHPNHSINIMFSQQSVTPFFHHRADEASNFELVLLLESLFCFFFFSHVK